MPFFSFGKFLKYLWLKERCHSSTPFFVIPVPRHWDPGILLSW
ncbi:MAG: hypothetical protein ACEY3F_05330 [Wolbachia sp.]